MPFNDVMYGYVYSLYQYIRSTWPVNIIYGPRLIPSSPETEEKIKRIFPLLKGCEDNTSKIFNLLKTLPVGEDWLSVVDEDTGYDVLQHAVLYRHKDVIVYLVTHDCDPNRYYCSPPVHLAAYLGEVGILQTLFELGAKANLKRGICYPEAHIPISYETRYFSFTEHPVYLCRNHRLTPIQCAIHRNNLSCVKVILGQENSHGKRQFSPQALLMYACKEGAPDCIRYFVEKYPECINSYLEGDTPLLAAVPWGEECANILLENGADVHLRSEGIFETALHRLYRQNIDGLFTIYDTTKYLLTTGIEQEVNAYTHLGETPLHMLISHVSYTGGNYVDPQRQIPRTDLQDSYQRQRQWTAPGILVWSNVDCGCEVQFWNGREISCRQVLDAIRLLLEFNADPHLLNSPGLTSLSRLLHIGLKAVHVDDKCSCVHTSQPNMFIHDYRHDYKVLVSAMEILLEFGSDPNFKCSIGHTPLILYLQLLLYDDLANLCSQHDQVVKALEVLLTNGADANFTDGGRGTTYNLLAAISLRCFQGEHRPQMFDTRHHPPQSLREQFADVMNDVLATMLQYGLEPNHTSVKTSQHLQGGNGNGLIEFVKLASKASSSYEFGVIEKWIKTLLLGGADPDLEPYPAEPIICHCQSSIFLKKLGTQPLAHFIHEVKDRESLQTNPAVQRIIILFHNSMSDKVLRNCLIAIKGSLHIQPLSSSTTPTALMPSVSMLCDGALDLHSLINVISDRPRSLKEISRVAIFRALKRDIALHVDRLPLPYAVKNYLLEVV